MLANFLLEIEHFFPSEWHVRFETALRRDIDLQVYRQKLLEVEDERKLRVFMDRKMGNEVPADSLGDEWKGYVWNQL